MQSPSNRQVYVFVGALFAVFIAAGAALFVLNDEPMPPENTPSEMQGSSSSSASSEESSSESASSSESGASESSEQTVLSEASSSAVSSSSAGNTDEATIRAFYAAIAAHDFETAYGLYAKPKISLQTFKGWYADVRAAKVVGFRELSPHLYTFSVQLTEQGKDSSEYEVKMYAENGKIETKSSVLLVSSENVCRGELCATVHTNAAGWQGVTITLINAKAPVMVVGNEEGVKILNLRFSPTGRYLLFEREFFAGGVTNRITFIYDINMLAQVADVSLESVRTQAWFFDDTRFVACGRGPGGGDGYVIIESFPEGKILTWERVSVAEPVCTVDTAGAVVSWTSPGVARQALGIRTGEKL